MSPNQPSERVRATIDAWKESLLDLSAANPLVALPEGGTVPMAAPNDVFDPLVRRRKPLTFWDINAKGLDRAILREPGNYPLRPAAAEALRHLQLRSSALLQGSDINVMYVAFGVMTWHDPNVSDAPVRSPLLLVPVTLEPHESGMGYIITCMEEPIEVNPVLKMRLAQPDVNIILPPAPDERYLVPSAYLSSVTTAVVEGREGWSVEENCLLGSFPLLKLRLYEDFIAQEERALSHPLIAALAGEADALTHMPAVQVPTLAEIEGSHSGEGQYLLLDADPAQQRAIIAAARGQSFVLQGPPGTGKTQTITNIITECIAAGKSVLLCSGRMASLDAVHQRLIEKGLGDLCLLAHSLKTSKRDILAHLETTLNSPRSAAAGSISRAQRQKEREELDTVRDRLNAFVHDLHRRCEPLGLTAYEALGLLAECLDKLPANAQDFSFVPDSPADAVTAEELRRMEAEAPRIAALAARGSAAPSTSTASSTGGALWANAFRESDRPDLSATVRSALTLSSDRLRRVEHSAQALAPLCGMPAAQTLPAVDRLLETATVVAATPSGIPATWFTGAASSPAALREEARGLAQKLETQRTDREGLLRTYEAEILDLAHADLRAQLTTRGEEILKPLLGDTWQERALEEHREIAETLGDVADQARHLHEKLLYLSEKSGLPLDESPEGRINLLRIAKRAIDLPNPCIGWFAPGNLDRMPSHLNEAEARWKRHKELTDNLFSVYDEGILDLDHNGLKETLSQQKGGLLGLLNTATARATSTIRGTAKSGASIKDRDLIKDLELATEVRDLRRWAAGSAERLSTAFGIYYKGGETDWKGLRAQLAKAQELCDEFSGERVPAPLIALMLLGDSDLKEFEQVCGQVGELLSGLRNAWGKLASVGSSLPAPQSPLVEIAAWCDARRKALHEFYEAYGALMGHRVSKDAAAPQPTIAEVVADLDKAEQLQAIRAALDTELEAASARFAAPALFTGRDTDWAALENSLAAAERLQALFAQQGTEIPAPLLQILAGAENAGWREEMTVTRQTLQEERDALETALGQLDTLFRPEYLATIADAAPYRHAELGRLGAWLGERLAAAGEIEQGREVQRARDEAAALGLGGFYDALQARPALPSDTVVAAFRAGFYRNWIAAVSAREGMDSDLVSFIGDEHTRRIDRFCELDRRQIETVPAQIRELTKGRSPKQYADEVKALKGQLARRRTGEVRKLLAEIPNLLFALKPCIMMNPLSVRLFLDADALRFDVVLFDDASQISTEDAIGAILRGKQVIIAGDPKQIPPLALLRPTDKPFESILDAASGVAAKDSLHFSEHTLRWHYRSMNESLIAFSRRHFYPELVSFPAARVDSAITFVGCSDMPEDGPRRVVDSILEYAAKHPEHSVGIVALDEIDHEAILSEITRRREENPELTLPRETEDVEQFFVKTLENVQGDERDMTLLYVGPEPSRCVPLKAAGGERLLNVATTRARHQMIIVSALADATSADASATEDPGIRLLRAFLDYAQNGSSRLANNTESNAATSVHPPQGQFEQIVESALVERGYAIRRQVGVSEYRVDLAIIDPENPDRFLLGIECDGATYARGETARHRDRLRPEMLTARGWHLQRVWSLDWSRDPNRQIKLIESALKSARTAGENGTAGRARRSSKKKTEVEEVAVAAG